ncbi:MAG: RidA family protein [Chloroflexi bacterium]|nr:RidA family protein [Chloroflexota bacterium]
MPLDRQYINPEGGPAPIAYTHTVKMGNLVFVSGQLPIDKDRQLVAPGDLRGQTRQALDNITRNLTAAGASWKDVAKVTIFVVGMEQIGAVREAREAFYAEQGVRPPASTAIGVERLAVEGAMIEIEAYAVVEA